MSYRVLLLDDDENVRISMAMLLENEGYEVFEASNLSEARQLMKSVLFDLAILDRKVNGFLGTDLIDELRAVLPECVIAVISGDSSGSHADINMTKGEQPASMLAVLASRLKPQ